MAAVPAPGHAGDNVRHGPGASQHPTMTLPYGPPGARRRLSESYEFVGHGARLYNHVVHRPAEMAFAGVAPNN